MALAGWDFSSLRAELKALGYLLKELAEIFPDGLDRKLVVVMDSLSAIKLVKGRRKWMPRATLVHQIRRWLHTLGDAVELVWTPSHGKRPEWRVDAAVGLDTLQCRKVNDSADEECTKAMEEHRLRQGLPARQWRKSHQDLREWASTALADALEVHRRYIDFYRDLGALGDDWV